MAWHGMAVGGDGMAWHAMGVGGNGMGVGRDGMARHGTGVGGDGTAIYSLSVCFMLCICLNMASQNRIKAGHINHM
jgi:hypothetical protein